MLDLDAIQARVDTHADTVADVRGLLAELRAAREIGHALERWVALPGMFWGDTPETGSEVGAALTNWQKVTGDGS